MKFLSKSLIIILLVQILFAPNSSEARRRKSTKTDHTKVMLGIDTLKAKKFKPLHKKRVGLLTHPAGVDQNGRPTVDILFNEPSVDLVALFGPEHGIYGDEGANIPVDNKIDSKTGLPIYSLYQKFRKPTPKMLEGLDVLVIDLQDIGARSYTYISCMKLTMEACFENGVEVMVLDRPNPLNGLKTAGPMINKKWKSYVGSLPIPYVHGLTIGEIAIATKRTTGWLDVTSAQLRHGKLTVIPMRGWKRKMTWNETGLAWVPTSPYIPSFSAVLGYSMTGLGAQLGQFRHGIGSEYPFRLLSFKGVKPTTLKKALQHKQIPGLKYSIETYEDKHRQKQKGVYVNISNYDKVNLTDLSFYMMQLACRFEKSNPFKAAKESDATLFNKHVGSSSWWKEISARGSKARVKNYLRSFKKSSGKFQDWSKKFWLYG